MMDQAPQLLFHFPCYKSGAYTRAALISTTGKTLENLVRCALGMQNLI